ncbi:MULTISPECIES: LysR family transcriptional regulator [unclassified Rathayibacter]|uniref:LysR substrate-binding domain-containing protein n=1 Tax=unclassified Rathayibacter TaxID=2609250 RepID=UPI000CE7DF5F|nr:MULTISPECIES: LysR family transcriptional regulator [unclassified Rathayibacter]PPG04429.1 hypothetical protein C5C26_13990 [Rathayibacter sp. AY2B1]PPG68452.1 hypothetical protein C5C59_12725 [Rathayibacter sp. AY1F4]
MSVTLRQVEIFIGVAQALHFGRAAEAMNISQATVSQEVRRLEVELGLSLFRRSTRSVVLTPAGVAVLEEGRALLEAAASLTDRAKLFRDEYVNRLRVVASPSVVNRLLPQSISRAESALPDLRIEEVAAESGEVAAKVLARGADLGIGRFLTVPPGYQKEKLTDEAFVVALSVDHPLAQSASVQLADLGSLPLLLWGRDQAPEYYDALLELCHIEDFSPLVLVSPPRIVGSRLYLIAEGRAFSLVPESIVPFLPAGVRGIPLARPASLPLEVLYRINDPRDGMTSFLDILRSVARSPSGSTPRAT